MEGRPKFKIATTVKNMREEALGQLWGMPIRTEKLMEPGSHQLRPSNRAILAVL